MERRGFLKALSGLAALVGLGGRAKAEPAESDDKKLRRIFGTRRIFRLEIPRRVWLSGCTFGLNRGPGDGVVELFICGYEGSQLIFSMPNNLRGCYYSPSGFENRDIVENVLEDEMVGLFARVPDGVEFWGYANWNRSGEGYVETKSRRFLEES